MTGINEVLPILIGNPIDDYQRTILYIISGLITTICILFFLKLFLLIAGFTKAR